MPLRKPLPAKPPGADGDLGLDDLVAGAPRVAGRVDEGRDPLLLVVLEGDVPAADAEDERGQDEQDDRLPPQPGQDEGPADDGHEGHGRPQVRLGDDQQERHAGDEERPEGVPASSGRLSCIRRRGGRR